MTPPRDFPSSVVAASDLSLRLAHDTDAELICDWTRASEVNRFWAGRMVPVDEVLAKYTGRRAPHVVSYVITHGLDPVGYVQAWQQEGRFGLDMFVAAEAQGQGVGPRAARALALALTALGWTPLTVDPAIDNPRAIRAWSAAGFVPTGEFGVDHGKATRIMSFTPLSMPEATGDR
jgi:aminoglycoside 6'-N-acetyltransferase